MNFNVTFNKNEKERAPAALIALFILLLIGIIASGFYYFTHYEKRYRTDIDHLLSSIADLKVSELVQWRKERLAVAAILYGNKSFVQMTRQIMDDSADKDAEKSMRLWLHNMQTAYQYKNVIFLDATGGVRLAAVGAEHSVCDQMKQHILQIRQGDKPAFLDFHRETQGGPITLSVLAPIFDKKRLLGVVAMVIDPEAYLFPLIRRWPTPSETAETLLVRKEGNEVVFLNELKFQKNSALSLRFPLSKDDLPAARAARGEDRVMEGIDYRGVPVIAALRTVPDSPWFMVARMDKDEIYASLRERFWIMMALVLALISGAGAGVLFLWQRRNISFNARQVEAALALQASEEKFRKAFMTSPDAILITSLSDNRVVSANDGFLQITGYARQEVEGRKVAELLIWANIDDRLRLIEKMKAEGSITNAEARFRRKNGDFFYGLVSASLLDLNGETHLLSMTRDITERKAAEDALHQAHERLRRFHDSNIVGIVIATAAGGIVEANDYYLNLIGFSQEEFKAGKIDWRTLTPPEWLAADEKAIAEVRRYGSCKPYEKQYLRRDGTRVDVFLTVARLPGPEEQLAAFALDITERKKVEQEVLRLNEQLEERVAQRTAELLEKNEELERLNRVFVDRELRMRELKEKIAGMEKGAS